MRHAKSAYPAGVPDHERPLNERGARDANAAADWFTAHCPRVDLVLVSDATRAQRTWRGVAPGIHADEVRTVPELYDAHPLTILRALAALGDSPGAPERVLMIAHNPGIAQVALRIASVDPRGLLPELALKYPTGAITRLRVGDWSSIEDGDAELLDYAVPRAA